MYGWIEPGHSNLFQYTNGDDLVIRTASLDRKLVLGNGSTFSAALYVCGNNVGINKVPDYELDVNGTINMSSSNDFNHTLSAYHCGMVVKNTEVFYNDSYGLQKTHTLIYNKLHKVKIAFSNVFITNVTQSSNNMDMDITVDILNQGDFDQIFNLSDLIYLNHDVFMIGNISSYECNISLELKQVESYINKPLNFDDVLNCTGLSIIEEQDDKFSESDVVYAKIVVQELWFDGSVCYIRYNIASTNMLRFLSMYISLRAEEVEFKADDDSIQLYNILRFIDVKDGGNGTYIITLQNICQGRDVATDFPELTGITLPRNIYMYEATILKMPPLIHETNISININTNTQQHTLELSRMQHIVEFINYNTHDTSISQITVLDPLFVEYPVLSSCYNTVSNYLSINIPLCDTLVASTIANIRLKLTGIPLHVLEIHNLDSFQQRISCEDIHGSHEHMVILNSYLYILCNNIVRCTFARSVVYRQQNGLIELTINNNVIIPIGTIIYILPFSKTYVSRVHTDHNVYIPQPVGIMTKHTREVLSVNGDVSLNNSLVFYDKDDDSNKEVMSYNANALNIGKHKQLEIRPDHVNINTSLSFRNSHKPSQLSINSDKIVLTSDPYNGPDVTISDGVISSRTNMADNYFYICETILSTVTSTPIMNNTYDFRTGRNVKSVSIGVSSASMKILKIGSYIAIAETVFIIRNLIIGSNTVYLTLECLYLTASNHVSKLVMNQEIHINILSHSIGDIKCNMAIKYDIPFIKTCIHKQYTVLDERTFSLKVKDTIDKTCKTSNYYMLSAQTISNSVDDSIDCFVQFIKYEGHEMIFRIVNISYNIDLYISQVIASSESSDIDYVWIYVNFIDVILPAPSIHQITLQQTNNPYVYQISNLPFDYLINETHLGRYGIVDSFIYLEKSYYTLDLWKVSTNVINVRLAQSGLNLSNTNVDIQFSGFPLIVIESNRLDTHTVKYKCIDVQLMASQPSIKQYNTLIIQDFITHAWRVRKMEIDVNGFLILELSNMSQTLYNVQQSQLDVINRCLMVIPVTLRRLHEFQSQYPISTLSKVCINTNIPKNNLTINGGLSVSKNFVFENDIETYELKFNSNILSFGNDMNVSNSSATINMLKDVNIHGTVTARNYLVVSDQQFKTGIEVTSAHADLDIIDQLNVVTFNYKDMLSVNRKGVIANDVEMVIPDAVSYHTGFIPNIMSYGMISNGKIMLEINQANNIKINSILRVQFHDTNASLSPEWVDVVVLDLSVSHELASITVNKPLPTKYSQVFIYGIMDTYKVVDHDYLYMTCINAVKALKSKVDTLEKLNTRRFL